MQRGATHAAIGTPTGERLASRGTKRGATSNPKKATHWQRPLLNMQLLSARLCRPLAGIMLWLEVVTTAVVRQLTGRPSPHACVQPARHAQTICEAICSRSTMRGTQTLHSDSPM